MIGISACLGGVMCRYDGQHQAVAQLVELVQTGQAVMVCPEVLGGWQFLVSQQKLLVGTVEMFGHKKPKSLLSLEKMSQNNL